MQHNTDSYSWDDTALVDNWNAAVEEYEKYHSKEFDEPRMKKVKLMESRDSLQSPDRSVEEEHENEHEHEHEQTQDSDINEVSNREISSDPVSGETIPKLEPSVEPLPAAHNTAVISLNGLDEDVKKLAMAWYWAGYYQGLQQSKKSNT